METKMRLLELMNELKLSPSDLARKLKYKRVDSIYNLLSGKSKMSENFYNRLSLSDLQINIKWLKTGLGPIQNHKKKIGGYGQEISFKDKFLFPSNLNFNYLEELVEIIANFLEINENVYYKAKARKCIDGDGLEFKFTEYSIYKAKILKLTIKRITTILISPDWEVIDFRDKWISIGRRNKFRNQDLFKIDNDLRKDFNNVLNPFIEKLSELTKKIETYDQAFIDGQYIKKNKYYSIYDPEVII